MSLLNKLIEKRLGGYTQQINTVDASLPAKIDHNKSVAIIGGGLAGISAAVYLAERGFTTHLYEKENFIGGKVGSWTQSFDDGTTLQTEHGFHAFFRQYYNLRALLEKIGSDQYLIPIDDYLILTKDQRRFSFKDVATTPVANILSMRKSGIYSFKDILKNPKFSKLTCLLQYDPVKTFEQYDNITFQQFADEVKLPPEMRLMFTTFSRAFFAEPQYMSMAELIKSFHFYFLSNDHGLLYDVLDDDFEKTLWQPALKFLKQFDFQLFLKTAVEKIETDGRQFSVHGNQYDYLILAADVGASQKIVAASPQLQKAAPQLATNMKLQKQSQKYAVLRIWTDRDLTEELPFFIFTEAFKVLDSITIYHRMEKQSAQWVQKNGGGIYELHSYALPQDFDDRQQVRDQLLEEFFQYFPEMKSATIRYEHLQLRDDFTAFHTDLHKNRPHVQTELPNLFLAGDWVKLPVPAMLMEAATTSALLAANQIAQQNEVQREPEWTVPLRGLIS